MDSPTMENRAFSSCELRVEDSDTGPGRLVGYAAVFGVNSEPLPFIERVAPGAFRSTLRAGDDVRALREHNPAMILGRTRSGTLRLREDKRGLLAEIDPPNTQLGRETVKLVERGDLSQMSFAFQTIDDEWATENGDEVRTLKRVKLYDVSVVAFPAYQDTSLAQRSYDQWVKNMAEYRNRLLEAKR